MPDPSMLVRVYQRNADEFTDSMTALVELETSGGKQQVRIFSLRGCHLLAMLARTKIAKEFRQWILDVLDHETALPDPNVAQTLLLSEQQILSELIHAKVRTAPDPMYRKAVSEIWSRFKNKFRVPRYADLPRDQLTDAILYVNALNLHCLKRLAGDSHPPLPPFLQGEFGLRLLIRLEGGDRYSVTHLGITEIVVDLADLIAIDQALDTWRDFAKRKELGYYRAGAAHVANTRP
ncbi:MAG TPA: ORF6C domain-containing protein [Candidatus Competibacter phosphatis]|nr:ORF6C domain-containing protein [Candidatus Competibacter phosphatis]